jgi:predicted RNA binding protein YcfA (HicA-like mRNA interferase family)
MNVGEAQKLLTKKGFTRRNQVGSHITYVMDDKRVTLVLHSSPKEIVHKKTEKLIKELIK